MIKEMEEFKIIQLKLMGWSNRKIEREFDVDRKTVAKYWNNYNEKIQMLENCQSKDEIRQIKEEIIKPPAYDTSGRKKRKYNDEIDQLLDQILEDEEKKTLALGPNHKQKLTNVQIHQMIIDEGYDIGLSTINNMIKQKRDTLNEAFIKQIYDFGERFEYDFGEAKIFIGDDLIRVYMAVFACPASGFRWAYLYRSQKMDVFIDSHSRFFEMLGGAFKEGVYDNMKNVVTRFIGKNEKELNSELINLSKYYGYIVNVTNCFSGNEKGTVESSVKWVRNRTFAIKYRFESFEEAEEYLHDKLDKLNARSTIEEEKKYLSSYRPPYEMAEIHLCHVDKYSFVQIKTNYYSVDDSMVGKKIIIKEYPNEIIGFHNGVEVCHHKKARGKYKTCIDIVHYLRTLQMKPGAVRNSAALRSIPDLKDIFDTNYTTNPRKFIELLTKHKDESTDEIISILKREACATEIPESYVQNHVEDRVDEELKKLAGMFIGGAKIDVN